MMDIETRLAAIEELQNTIINLLRKKDSIVAGTMTLKEAADYVGYSHHYFRRLAVEQRRIPFSRPSGQQQGKLLFQKSDLDDFLQKATFEEKVIGKKGRKRKPKKIGYW